MASRGAIQQGETVAVPRTRGLSLPFDPVLLLAVLALAACSLITVAAATADDVAGNPHYFVTRQALYFGAGGVLAILLWRMDYSRLREVKLVIYGLLIASILAVMAFGSVARGSRRAIDLPFFSFQASELGKVLLIVSLSAFMVDSARRLGDRRTTARIMLLALIPAALVMLQPDLGSALVYIVIGLATLFVAGTPWRHFAALGALVAVAVALALVALPAAGVSVLHGYQKDRLTAFLHPSDTASKESYQQHQSRIAIGSGEKTGRGDDATQTRYNFLPEHHTDFVFAVVGERWGFAGAALVLSLYALLIWRGLRILTVREEPVRRNRRRRHRLDAAVPGLRQRRDERGNHADHRHSAAADELRRLLDRHHHAGDRPPAVDSCTGASRGGVEGTGAHLLNRNELRPVKKQVLVSVDAWETRVALLEQAGTPTAPAARRRPKGADSALAGYRVAELYIERRGSRSIVGNVYLGKVDNVLDGLEAAFIDIGLEKNGFLHIDEIVLPGVDIPRRGRGQEGGKRISEILRPGQEVVVQVVKDPLKTKGARLSMDLTIAGRYMVYTPTGEGLGVSKRLEDKERERLRRQVKGLDLKGGGAIVRTAAHGAVREDFERELPYLFKLHEVLQQRVKKQTAPSLVFQEADLSVRVVRDIFSADFERAIVDDEKQYQRLVSFFTRTAPELVDRVELHQGSAPLFEEAGVDEVIAGLTSRRVDLPERRLPEHRLRRGADRLRRELRLVRRPRQAGPARGHDHQDEPRGRRRGRAPAAAARHRRHHRHRLHRHGEGAQPRGRPEDVPPGARPGPHEDVHRGDLEARARRDDAPERDRGRARDHLPHLPDLRRRRRRPQRGDGRDRVRPPAARARGARAAHDRGVPRSR